MINENIVELPYRGSCSKKACSSLRKELEDNGLYMGGRLENYRREGPIFICYFHYDDSSIQFSEEQKKESNEYRFDILVAGRPEIAKRNLEKLSKLVSEEDVTQIEGGIKNDRTRS